MLLEALNELALSSYKGKVSQINNNTNKPVKNNA